MSVLVLDAQLDIVAKRRIDYAIIVSIVIHILLIFLFFRASKSEDRYADIKQITFIDQTYRPEVAKILPKPPVPAGSQVGQEKGITPETPTLVGSQRTTGEEISSVDLTARLDRSQAIIDLNRYEIDPTDDELDVIRIGSKANGKTTEEILAEKPIELSKGLSRGPSILGLAGYPGIAVNNEPPIQIEHKTLEKPQGVTPTKFSVTRKNDVTEVLEASPVRGANISIAGPISKRSILSKVLPQYPEWALERGISGIVIIRIWVMPDGGVKETMAIEQSSGYPELDQLVVNALKRWKFAPLDKSVVQEVQWGVITFRFCLI